MKRFLSLIIAILMVLPLATAFVTAKSVETVTEYAIPDPELLPESNDELFAGYVDKQFYSSGISLFSGDYGSVVFIDPVAYEIYDYTKDSIENIAANGGSAVIKVPESICTQVVIPSGSGMSMSEYVNSIFPISLFLDCILADCPYELYWFDKTEGVSRSISWGGNTLYGLTIEFAVNQEYQGVGHTEDTPVVTTSVSAIQSAVTEARRVVTANASLSDMNKLTAYRNYIIDNVSYNHDAADDPNTPYGNPWQMIWVFDNDPSTKVVCEGYSKAFAYLCELSDFLASDFACYLASGDFDWGTGGGPHMWNIVTINNTNYLVDVTNDDDSHKLFMVSNPDYSTPEVCGIDAGYRYYTYTYDDDTLGLYSDEIRKIGFRSTPSTVKVTSISLDKTALSLDVDNTFTLLATVNPTNATNKSITWHTSDSSIATVNSNGKVTAVGTGTANIWATANDGSGIRSANCVVTVNPKNIFVIALQLNRTSLSLEINESFTLFPTVTPSNATDQTVTWYTSDSSVATVNSNGKVTAGGVGTANIWAIANDGSYIASDICVVTVNPITITEFDMNLSSAFQNPVVGESSLRDLSVLADMCDGYNFSFVIDSGISPYWYETDGYEPTGYYYMENEFIFQPNTRYGLNIVLAPDENYAFDSDWISEYRLNGAEPQFYNIYSDGSIDLYYELEVSYIPVTSISLDKYSLTLDIYDSYTLSATVLPSNAFNTVLTWFSSDSSIATVDSNGNVTAVGAGTAEIWAVANDGSEVSSYSCYVTVNAPAITEFDLILDPEDFRNPVVGGSSLRDITPLESLDNGYNFTLLIGRGYSPYWYEMISDNDYVLWWIEDEFIFESGIRYGLNIMLESDSDYVFDEAYISNYKLNGKAPQFYYIYSNGRIDLYYEMDVIDNLMIGDIDGNGEITYIDYMLLKRAVMGTYTLTDEAVADVSGDGTVNYIDYMLLKRAVMGTYEL